MLTAAVLLAALPTAALLAAVLWSVARPEQRLWPPPKQRPRDFAAVWLLSAVVSLALLTVGVLDPHRRPLPLTLRYGVGGPLFVAGLALAWTAAVHLGLLATAGKAVPRVTTGPYRRFKHPQYFGNHLTVAGWAVLTASPRVAALSALCSAVFLAFPFAEAAWHRKGPEPATPEPSRSQSPRPSHRVQKSNVDAGRSPGAVPAPAVSSNHPR